jgi:hypothetical protein
MQSLDYLLVYLGWGVGVVTAVYAVWFGATRSASR